MTKTIVSFAAIAATLAATPVQAQDIRTYSPDSTWVVDYGEDYCRLIRDFSDGEDTVSLLLERTHPSNTLRIVVVGDSLRVFRGANSIGFRFLPGGSDRMAPRAVGELGDGQQYINLGNQMVGEFEIPGPGDPPPLPGAPYSRESDAEKAAQIDGIHLDQGLTDPARIMTGSLSGPVVALQACTDDMLTYWGLDAEAHQTLSRSVLPGNGTIEMGDNGFPVNPSAGWIAQGTVGFGDFALLNGATNEVRVMVNAAGEATDCAVHFPTLDESTNESICEQVLENSEFQPALDAEGNAIDSYWMTGVFGLLPPFGR